MHASVLVPIPRDVDGLDPYYRQHRLVGLAVFWSGLAAASWWMLFVALGGAGHPDLRLLVAGLAPCIFLVGAGALWWAVAAPLLQARVARRLS